MDDFLAMLLSRVAHASVQAVVLTAVVFLVCRYARSLSASAKTVLWWLLGAQLVVGVACPVVLGLPVLPASQALAVSPVTLDAATGGAPHAWTAGFDLATTTTTTSAFSWTGLLFAAWLTAVLVQAGIAAVRWYHLSGIVERAMPHDDIRVETLCARRARELGLRRSPRLAVTDEVDSPQVIGLWRPTILLPLDDRLDANELDMALMHELAHVRRGDLVLGWVPVLARTLFFFHPVVHLAMREYALCREAACDALVVSRGRQAPRNYGRLLVRLGVSPHPHHALPGASPTFQTLKRRLDMLAHANDTQPRLLTWCIVAAIAAVGVIPWRVVAAESGKAHAYTFATAAPAPPAPPAPPPAAPEAPPAPDMPAEASAAAPAMPAMPAMPAINTANVMGGGPSQAFFFVSHGVNVMSGSESDLRRAETERNNSDYYAWFRDGKQAWVLRDPEVLKRISAAYARAAQPADKAAMSADKRMELDRRQAMLNQQMAKLSVRQTELAMKESDPMGHGDRAAYAAGHAAIAREQTIIAGQMAEIGKVRVFEGQTEAEWSRRQAAAARKSTDEVNAILAEAIRDHKAQASR
jgi:bla regulator protein BlaR1